jgi:D-xylose 1-dehydrogenase
VKKRSLWPIARFGAHVIPSPLARLLPSGSPSLQGKKLWLTPKDEAETLARQCLKRMLVPDDVARVVVFLASDEAAACTSQTFVVDAGLV